MQIIVAVNGEELSLDSNESDRLADFMADELGIIISDDGIWFRKGSPS